MSSKDGDTAQAPGPHHISDVDTWGKPDRNYYIYIVLSFLLGFLGFDHYYLRSYDTGFKKMVVNIFGLGFWYFWDLIQIMKNGKDIRKEGLNSPMDWIRGIGRGTFVPPPQPTQEGGKPPTYEAPKSYLVYTFLAMFFGWLGADYFYLGEYAKGLGKLLSVFNIFLFLFGILWVLWDSFNAFFRTKSIMKDGISPPPPFSIFFSKIDAKPLFKVVEVKEDEEKEKDKSWFPVLPSFSLPWRELYRELVVPLLQPTVSSTAQKVNQGIRIGEKAVALGTSALATAPAMVSAVKAQVENAAKMATNPADALKAATAAAATTSVITTPAAAVAESAFKMMPTVGQQDGVIGKINEIASAAETARKAATVVQQGGAMFDAMHGQQASGAGPVIAGTLTALVIAGGAKGLYDFISKQYG
jgi:TM2 domain-containing membrane protein YozV